jgi:nucleoside-diphosphate-sugar epimerase
MSTSTGNQWALYGGAGFIGQHLARSILDCWPQDHVHLLDIQHPSAIRWKLPLEDFIDSGRLQVRQCDVRDADSLRQNAAGFDVIVNLAAVHREPGHKPEEYFATNVAGARNVCRLAEEVGCREILFTSSISVYGIHDRPVDEDSAVQPRTPYGQSKHQAEQIHLDWARRSGGRLAVIRPGVVFGAGEEGNVTRLVAEMRKRHRAIRVQPDQPKASIYIEELIDIMHWLRQQPVAAGESQLVNGVSREALTFNAYADVLQDMHGWTRPALDVPGSLLRALVAVMNPLAGLFPAGSRIHPQRLGKLLSANDVRPSALTTMGYPFRWPLERALADWLAKGL